MKSDAMGNPSFNLSAEYRNIFIVDSVGWWSIDHGNYDPSLDLVLTYDFGLKKKISELGGHVAYIDHLVDKETMQANNFLIYEFFRKWHFDANGKDIFIHKDIPFGFSFRIDFWNDFTFYIRVRICLSILKNIKSKAIFVGSENNLISSILDELQIVYALVAKNTQKCQAVYYFPIAKWMDEKLRATGVRGFLYRTREVVTAAYGYLMPLIDKCLFWRSVKKTVFIQEYHPTKKIIEELKKDSELQAVLVNFTRGTKLTDYFSERLVPISGSLKKYNQEIASLMDGFRLNRCARLVLADGQDISGKVYQIIEKRIAGCMAKTLRTLDSIIHYLERNRIDLEILISNIGHTTVLMDCVCKHKGIPSYLVINGMLGNAYLDESKYATVINSYSTSIRDNYFSGMENIVCLGDPRMDAYAFQKKEKKPNTKNPTVVIGASGFNNVDLNSYVAVEFEFMHEILSAFRVAVAKGVDIELIIKVRPNGYQHQYESFIQEFFPDLSVEIVSTVPMKTVLEKSDFYVSIYSQTLFEASCLGIPCVYYKKDDEIMDTPFDGNSELVTVDNVSDLVDAFFDFQAGHERYNAFLDRKVMERYIGPLDGNNLNRNIEFIYELLRKHESR